MVSNFPASKCLPRSTSLDVTFDKVGNQANHFRLMIDPKARGFKENQPCGWAAKVEPNNARSHLVPIYRGDDGAFMNIGGYVCYRRYYCTCADPPKNRFADRNQKPPPLFTCPHPKVHKDQHHVEGSDNAVASDGGGVETPLDITTDGTTPDEFPDVPATLPNDPPSFTVGSSDDPDSYSGENIDNKLYEDGEF